MNRPAVIALLLIGGGLLLIGGQRDGGPIDGDGNPLDNWNLDALADNAMNLFNRAQDAVESATDSTPADQAAVNEAAFLTMIGQSEGADYTTCYGYSHTITDMSDHPAVTGEWVGLKLPDQTCINAGFSPGCKSTAAGKYQIIAPTWRTLKAQLGLPDFSPESQDRAALQLISQWGALTAVQKGDVATAVARCKREWASLPGNGAGQGQHSLEQLQQWFADAGGQAVNA